jgi:hypothetical protein
LFGNGLVGEKEKPPIPTSLKGPYGEYNLFAFITNDTGSFWPDTVQNITVRVNGVWWKIISGSRGSALTEEELGREIQDNCEAEFLFYANTNSLPTLRELARRVVSCEHIKLNPQFSRAILESYCSTEMLEDLFGDFKPHVL